MPVDPPPLLLNPDVWTPADSGFIAAPYDPAIIANSGALANGTIYFVVLPIRIATIISKVWFGFAAAAVTPTAGENYFGLYGPIAGTTAPLLSSVGADALVLSTGPVAGTLAAAQSIQPGLYACAIVVNAATPPSLYRQIGNATMGNANLAGATLRFFHNGTGQIALPGSITLASNVADVPIWAAVN